MAETTIHGIEFQIKGNADSATKAIEKLEQTLKRVKQTTSRGLGLKSIVKDMQKLGNTKLSKAFTFPLRSGIKQLKEYGSKLGGVLGGFKRIVGYRIIRSIIKEITQGFQEGTKNLYEWSTLVGGTFAKNMDDAATSMLYFKNSVGAAWSPLMNVLAPALRAVTDAAVDLLNIINQLIARLTGQTSWTRAKRVATEYGDAVAGAGQAAKEAIRYLAPFDELNVLPDDKDRGGGGGAANNVSEMFEEVATFDEGISDFADKVREAIQSSNWTGLGVLLGEKVNEVVDSLDWSGAGTKVGKGINAWFTTKYWTLETINFQNIGSKIAEFLNNAVSNIDFNIIGRSLTQKFTIIGDFILGAVENIDWAAVGNSIRDFLVGAFNQMSQWAKSIDWRNFGDTLYNDLKSLFEGLDFAGIAQSFFTFLGRAIGAATGVISSFIQNAVADIYAYFKSFIQDSNGDGEITGGEIWSAIGRGLVNAIKGIKDWIKKNVWTPFVDGFKETAGFSDEEWQKIGQAILDGIANPFKKIKEWWQEKFVEPFMENWNEFVETHPKLSEWFGLEEFDLSVDVEANAITFDDSGIPPEEKVVNNAGAEVTYFDDYIDQRRLENMIACVNEVEDKTPQKEKILEGFDAYVYDFKDYIDQRELENMMADVVAVKDEVPKAERKLSAFEAIINTAKDEITDLKNKVVNGVKAIFGSTDQSALPKKEKTVTGLTGSFSKTDSANLTAAQKTIPTTANFNSPMNSLTGKNKPSIPTTANFNEPKNSLTGKNKPTVPTTANFDNKRTGDLDKVINTTANFNKRKTGSLDKVINTVSNFTSRKTGFLDKVIDTVSNFTNWWNSLKSDPALDSIAKIISVDDKRPWYEKQLEFEAKVSSVTGIDAVTYGASGGVFGSKGKIADIPQYASGGRPHGSMFIAGEAGAELVGHIGGRTEVLNRSQLAATMYAAVHSAMAGVALRVSGMRTPDSADGGYDYEAIYRAVVDGIRDSGVGDEEITLDGDVLYRKMVQRNQMNTRMTGRNVMATA